MKQISLTDLKHQNLLTRLNFFPSTNEALQDDWHTNTSKILNRLKLREHPTKHIRTFWQPNNKKSDDCLYLQT